MINSGAKLTKFTDPIVVKVCSFSSCQEKKLNQLIAHVSFIFQILKM